MTQEKEIRMTYSFTGVPSIINEAKDNAWAERKSFSEIIEALLKRYNEKKAKEKKIPA